MENESVDGIYEQINPEKAIYNVKDYIFYNYGSGPGCVLMQNDKKQNTAIASGYYLITDLLNDAYDHINTACDLRFSSNVTELRNDSYNNWVHNLLNPSIRAYLQ